MASTGTGKRENFYATTELLIRKLRFVWTIRNFSFCTRETGSHMRSPIFGPLEGPRWRLSLYPNGVKEDYKDYVSLYLSMHSKGPESEKPTSLKYKFTLVNSKREAIYDDPEDGFVPYDIDSFEDGHGYNEIISRDKLLKQIKDDELQIRCEITIFDGDEIHVSSQSKKITICPEPECTLSDDFEKIFIDQKCGDTIIEVADKEFLVYRAILQIRSPVFAAMFEHELEEKIGNRVVITDAEPNVIEEMLTYIYSGRSPNIETMASDLLPIAEKYSLDQLKIMSTNVILENLTRENAVETLIAADLYRAKHLKKNVINFIAAESSYFLDDAVWEEVQSSLSKMPNLFMELVKAVCRAKK